MSKRARARRRGGLPLVRPTVRGWVMIAVGAVLLILSTQPGLSALAWPACLALAAPAAAAGVTLLRTRASVTARVLTPDVAVVGEPVTVRVRVGAAAGSARWTDARSSDLSGESAGVLRRDVDGALTAVARVVAVRRGRHETGPLSIEVIDAFGLLRARRALAGTASFVAIPTITPLAAPPTAADGSVMSTTDARRGLARGVDDQIPREWRSEDGIRRIHWRATAHRGELMVRQEEPHEDVGVAIVIDALGAHYRSPLELDRAVDLVASIAAASIDADARTSVTIMGEDADPMAAPTMFVRGPGATNTLEDVLVRLALLEPSAAPERHLRVPPAPVVVAVLGRIDESLALEISRGRRPGARGIAIVQGDLATGARIVLEHAGWSVVHWDSARGPAAIWADVNGADASGGRT